MAEIAVKNLQALNDILGAEKLNYKKLESYKDQVKDASLKNLIVSLCDSHCKHYQTVYSYLKSHE